MQSVTFNPLPAGARALTVDETAVVAGGIAPALIAIAGAIARAAAAGAKHFGKSAARGAGATTGAIAAVGGLSTISRSCSNQSPNSAGGQSGE